MRVVARRTDGSGAGRRTRVALGMAIAGAVAASLVAAAVVVTSRAGNGARQTLGNLAPEKSIAPGVPDVIAGAIAPSLGVESADRAGTWAAAPGCVPGDRRGVRPGA